MNKAFKILFRYLVPLGFLCGVSIILTSCNKAPKDAQCIPILYPTGNKSENASYELYNYQVHSAFTDVIDFFDQQLAPVSIYRDVEPGKWQITNISNSQVLYSCYATLNALEVELGCIYVKEGVESTTIKNVWYVSGDAGPWCTRDLSIEQ